MRWGSLEIDKLSYLPVLLLQAWQFARNHEMACEHFLFPTLLHTACCPVLLQSRHLADRQEIAHAPAPAPSLPFASPSTLPISPPLPTVLNSTLCPCGAAAGVAVGSQARDRTAERGTAGVGLDVHHTVLRHPTPCTACCRYVPQRCGSCGGCTLARMGGGAPHIFRVASLRGHSSWSGGCSMRGNLFRTASDLH